MSRVVALMGAAERFEWEWYDRLTIINGCLDLRFFQHSVGSAVSMQSDTNCEIAGQLAGKSFFCDGMAFMVRRKDRERWETLSHDASLQLRILDKIYRISHAATIPVLDQHAATYRKVTRKIRTPGRAYVVTTEEERVSRWHSFSPALLIEPYHAYEVVVTFYPKVQLQHPLPLGVVLHGQLQRPVL